MSFIASSKGYGFQAGYFLVDDENCTRQTVTVSQDHSQAKGRDGRFIVPAGAIIPANDATAKGILYEDIDVTDGDAPGSIVTAGKVYVDRLPDEPSEDGHADETGTETKMAKSTLEDLGIVFVESEPTITRPNFG